MHFIDGSRVRDVSYGYVVDGLARMHREKTPLFKDLLLQQSVESGSPNGFLVRAAWQYGAFLGVKMATVFPMNPAHEKPAVQAVYVLFDGADGSPLASIDGTELTYLKTAADSALGSQLLSRVDSQRLLMVGAGAMAPHLIRAHASVRPALSEVTVWNRTAQRAERLVETLRGDFDIRCTHDLEQAVKDADIVSCATMSQNPLIKGEWLSPGTHLDLVGAYTKDMREADDTVMRQGRIFVDSKNTTVKEIGELLIPIQSGVIDETDILGDLFELCRRDVKGRTDEREITVFKNGGGGHLDLMTARLIFESSTEPTPQPS